MKKQNVFFYFSALTSVMLVVMMFVPWIVVPSSEAGQHWLIELLVKFIPSLRSGLPSFFTENYVASIWDMLIESLNSYVQNLIVRFPAIIKEFSVDLAGLGIFGALSKMIMSVLSLIFSGELLVFLAPVFLGIVIVHFLYLISIFRPGADPFFPGTVTVLLAGIMLFLFLFGSDLFFSVIVDAELAGSDLPWTFLGLHFWTPVPYIWFALTLLQKWLFAKLAHKKKVISYT